MSREFNEVGLPSVGWTRRRILPSELPKQARPILNLGANAASGF